MSDKPKAVTQQVQAHGMTAPDTREQDQDDFWQGMRQVIREEMTNLLDERERRD